jgi:hypothetical protein
VVAVKKERASHLSSKLVMIIVESRIEMVEEEVRMDSLLCIFQLQV